VSDVDFASEELKHRNLRCCNLDYATLGVAVKRNDLAVKRHQPCCDILTDRNINAAPYVAANEWRTDRPCICRGHVRQLYRYREVVRALFLHHFWNKVEADDSEPVADIVQDSVLRTVLVCNVVCIVNPLTRWNVAAARSGQLCLGILRVRPHEVKQIGAGVFERQVFVGLAWHHLHVVTLWRTGSHQHRVREFEVHVRHDH
jgi:hypothetical protein